MSGNGEHAKCFNEVVRRIKLPQQASVSDKIGFVSEGQVKQMIDCCDNPQLLMTDYLDFVKSDDFPYIALRAFRDNKVNANEFGTLTSLQAIYLEGSKNNESFKIEHKPLFDKNGEPNREAWEAVEKTVDASTATEGGIFSFDTGAIIESMQTKIKDVRSIESVFWHYDQPVSEAQTIADRLRELGTCEVDPNN